MMADGHIPSAHTTSQHALDLLVTLHFYKRFAWLICAITALFSARMLLVERNIHYPLQLYCNQLVVTGLITFVPFRLWQEPREFVRERPKPQKSMTQGMMYSVASICCMAISTICTLQAILHLQNLPTLVMITVIAYFAEAVFLLVLRMLPYDRAEILRTIGLVLASVGILFAEYRLSVPGLVASILAMLFAGADRALCKTVMIHHPEAADYIRHPGRFAIIGALVGLVWMLVFRTTHEIFAVDLTNLPLLAVNALTSALALSMGRSILFPLDFEVADMAARFDDFLRQGINTITLFLYGSIVGCISTLLIRRSYMNMYQMICFMFALWCIARRTSINAQSTAHSTYELLGTSSAPSEGNDNTASFAEEANHAEIPTTPPGSQKPNRIIVGLFAIVMFGLWLAFAFLNFREGSEPRSSALLDLNFKPESDVEIVISMYKESPEEVGKVIKNLKSNPALSDAQTTIYIKDSTADNNDIKQQTGADRITTLPNIGREGETYLNHIINRWDNLATQTIFLQADIHNPREFYTHLNYYYRRSMTGFLNLGWSGAVCNCQSCGDKLFWQDNTHFLPQIYTRIYNTTDCENILLSYKGQFIVSAARIRGIDKEIYRSLWQAFVDEKSWAHQQEYLQGRPDSMNAPDFGYTMERMWNLLFQCNERDVAWKCPSLISKWRIGGDIRDCQCFDA